MGRTAIDLGHEIPGRYVDGRKRGAPVGRQRIEDFSTTRFDAPRKRSLLWLGRVAVVLLAVALFILVFAVAADTLFAQENPYLQEFGDGEGGSGGGILAPLQGLPIWAQAGLASAGAGLMFFGLIELGRAGLDRLQKYRGQSGKHSE